MEIKRTLIPPKTAEQKPIEICEYVGNKADPKNRKLYISEEELSRIADAMEKSEKDTKDGGW
ncbi:hypothetical protein [Hahella ganghwensis]|uniref:hypothetical protein n=1 Tax=Hahella ganghwensis TaxID=286420 RepID=UPI0003675247|nr:hypothetical protein [Hahella ganghwensis]